MPNDQERRPTGVRLFNPILWLVTGCLWFVAFVLARGDVGMLRWMYLALGAMGILLSILNFRDYNRDRELLAAADADHCPYCGVSVQPEFRYCPLCGAELPNRPDSDQ